MTQKAYTLKTVTFRTFDNCNEGNKNQYVSFIEPLPYDCDEWKKSSLVHLFTLENCNERKSQFSSGFQQSKKKKALDQLDVTNA